ncbi:acyltransferase family protein [Burkholderia ubonensis]|uniref:acyltransferase family protein n=1 Tax=Burkholderia ubonensis TaxID=101571 RepID=UPI0009B3FD4A|nr:acyltransferase [Burkholderia ubonensis]
MLGALRTFLALIVMAAHLGRWTDLTATYAVSTFFVISGYLMTATLHLNYGFGASGFFRFFMNRFLRLYPMYWVAAGMSVLLIALEPALAEAYHRNFLLPDSLRSWAGLAINWYWRPDFPMPNKASVSHVVPPAWALAVEFAMYVVLALGVARNIKTGVLCLLAGALFHVAMAHDVNERLYAIPAAALPYGIGICLYFAVKAYRTNIGMYTSIAATCLYGGFICALHLLPLDAAGFPYYLNLAAFAVTLFFIVSATEGSNFRWIDRNIGGLSYPIYLIHYQAAFLIQIIISEKAAGWTLFWLTLPLTVALSAALEYLNQQIVDPYRNSVRAKSDASPNGARSMRHSRAP